MGYPQAGAGLPAQGLALPGMAMNGMRGYNGFDGVKPETDDILRMRGGSVGPVLLLVSAVGLFLRLFLDWG
jgi:hypothetical protein